MVDAFLGAARGSDFETLLAVLDPDVVLRTDIGAVPARAPTEVRGAAAVARQAMTFARYAATARAALVNGAAGVVSWDADGKPMSVTGFTVVGSKIVEIDVLADPERLSQLDLAAFNNSCPERLRACCSWYSQPSVLISSISLCGPSRRHVAN